METIDINKYKESWKQENQKITSQNKLSIVEIQTFIHKQSKDVSQKFRIGIVVDAVIKSTLIVSYLILITLFWGDVTLISLNAILVLVSILLILFQIKVYKQIPGIESNSGKLNDILKQKIDFFNNTYAKSIYIGALTNPLFFISGMLFYFRFKYGEVRAMDLEDYIVFGTAILISYVFALVAQLKSYQFSVKNLQTCLKELNEDTITELTIKQNRNKKLRVFAVALLFLIIGLLLLFYIMAL